MLANEFLVAEIMQYLNRGALAACLRVNNTFFAEAGKVLYRITPVIDDSKMGSFFLGALDGFLHSIAESLQCSRHSCPLERRFRWRNIDCGSVGDAEVRRSRLNAKYLSMLTRDDLSRVNFKAQLLSYVKVLSIGSHHYCYCKAYGEYAGGLLPNMHTLRVVPTPVGVQEVDALDPRIVREPLESLCDSTGQCPLMCSLVFHCSKLVFRNLDGRGINYFKELYPDPPNLQEVVFFTPPCQKRLEPPEGVRTAETGEGPSDDIWNIACAFHSTPTVKLVLWYEWEGSDTTEPLTSTRKLSVTPTEIVSLPFRVFRSFNDPPTKRRYILVGLNDVLWRPTSDRLVWDWEQTQEDPESVDLIDPESLPEWVNNDEDRSRLEQDINAQNKKLLQVAKKEIEQGFPTLIAEETAPEEDRAELQFTKIEMVGLGQYLANVKDRRAEVSAIH